MLSKMDDQSQSIAPDVRGSLAKRQAAVVRALTGGGALPQEFDPVQVQTASKSLARKRKRGIQKAWPALSKEIAQYFVEYAAQMPPADARYDADATRFGMWLASMGRLPSSARKELAARRMARGFPLRIVFLSRRSWFRLLCGFRGAIRWFPNERRTSYAPNRSGL